MNTTSKNVNINAQKISISMRVANMNLSLWVTKNKGCHPKRYVTQKDDVTDSITVVTNKDDITNSITVIQKNPNFVSQN